VPGFFSSRPNWVRPPLTRRRVLPSLVPRGTHSLALDGMGGPNSDEGTDTVVHCRYSSVLYNPSPVLYLFISSRFPPPLTTLPLSPQPSFIFATIYIVYIFNSSPLSGNTRRVIQTSLRYFSQSLERLPPCGVSRG
jgi:hypothetical protein